MNDGGPTFHSKLLSRFNFSVNKTETYESCSALFLHRNLFTPKNPQGVVPNLVVRVVSQRVAEAQVSVANEIVGKIGPGMCVFVGIGRSDSEAKASALADKIRSLRVFEDDQGKMNRSLADMQGAMLVVSQFTLYADCKKGNRPSFTAAAPPAEAQILYDLFVERLRSSGLNVTTGRFQAKMSVSLVNDGPVTFILEA